MIHILMCTHSFTPTQWITKKQKQNNFS